MDRTNGAGHVNHLFVAEDAATLRPPSEITFDWLNNVQEEIAKFPESQGAVLDPANRHQMYDAVVNMIATAFSAGVPWAVIDQITQAAGLVSNHNNNGQLLESIQRLIDAQSGNYVLDTGMANAYVVAVSPAIMAYTNGMVVRLRFAHSNTGASTLDAGAGPLPLVNDVAGALVTGDAPAGGVATVIYDGGLNKFLITSLVQSQGDARYAALAGLASQVFAAGAATAAAHVLRADSTKQDLTSVLFTKNAGLATFGVQPQIVKFRNSDLTNGAPNIKFVAAPLSLSTTAVTASFGLTTGQQGRLALLVIDDGSATPRIGVVSAGGGINLNEEGVLTSTTAIAGAAISASTVYTEVALGAGLYPYKIVGAVDVVWTSGSGFVTAPALVTAAGGLALASLGGLGSGNYVDMTALRAISGIYYNKTGRPIFVCAYGSAAATAATWMAIVDGIVVTYGSSASTSLDSDMGIFFKVEPNKSYQIANHVGSSTLTKWFESF